MSPTFVKALEGEIASLEDTLKRLKDLLQHYRTGAPTTMSRAPVTRPGQPAPESKPLNGQTTPSAEPAASRDQREQVAPSA